MTSKQIVGVVCIGIGAFALGASQGYQRGYIKGGLDTIDSWTEPTLKVYSKSS